MGRAPLSLYRHVFKAMGSPCDLQLFASDAGEAERVARLARSEIERLEARYSRFRPESFLSEINRAAAAGARIEVDAETARLLDYADACFRTSQGLFDVTSGVLRAAWRFDGSGLPDAGRVQALLAKVGWQKLEWTPPVLGFPLKGIELDLGGVVKEYAVDRVVVVCREAGAAAGLVNLGGDVGVVGPRPDGAPWRIGIRHPRRPGQVLETFAMRSGALATSGDYERCIVIAGVRYGHILDPRTGWPARHLASVSVAADLCVVAGSAATIGVLKERQGPAWLAELGLPHLWVDVHGRAGGAMHGGEL
jgi:thiamine biosynthesis lipoprotein